MDDETQLAVDLARVDQRLKALERSHRDHREWTQGELLLQREDFRRLREARAGALREWVMRLAWSLISAIMAIGVSYVGVLLTMSMSK